MAYYIKKFWKAFASLTLFLVVTQTLTVYASVINANILNALIGRNLRSFLEQVIILLCIWGLVAVIEYGLDIYEQHLIQNLDIAIRADIAQTLTHESYVHYNRRDISVYESWLNNDLQLINQQGFESLFSVIEGSAGAVLALTTLAYFHWLLAVVAVFLTGIIIITPHLLDHQLTVVSKRLTHENEQFVAATHDALHAFNLLYAFQSLPLLIAKVHRASVKLKQANVDRTVVQTRIMMMGFLGNILSQVILMGLSGWLALQRLVSIGTISAVGSLASNVFNSLGNISNLLGLIRGTKPIFQKYKAECRLIAPYKRNVDFTVSARQIQKQQPVLTTDQLTFQFGNQQVFKNVSQTFYAGEKTLITGESGAGKSTFLKLLAGYLQPTAGAVKLGSISLAALSLGNLRGSILYLDQQPDLINGTVRE
ncbi:MAG TPA: hypothetical protein DCW31_05265, partial [Lactobacillus sp.]|nr:hypothetical protein [Lactobacillus sp.]